MAKPCVGNEGKKKQKLSSISRFKASKNTETGVLTKSDRTMIQNAAKFVIFLQFYRLIAH